MNNLFIGDNAEVVFGKSDSLSELASKIENIRTDEDVLFIYVNLKFHNSRRTDQAGIELLIWLRLKGIMNHCVLYSFETTHALLNRQPKYLIATSKGTSFIQMPEVLGKIDTALFARNKAEVENIKFCLKPSFNIEVIRHQEANWWGIKKLWDVHRIMLSKSKSDFVYPDSISLKEIDFESQLGVYIFDNSDSILGKAIELKVQLKEGIVLYQSKGKQWIESKIVEATRNDFSYKSVSKSLLHVTESRKPRILHIDDQWKDGWGEIFCKMIYGDTVYQIPSTEKNENSHNWNDHMVSVKPAVPNLLESRNSYLTFLEGIELAEFDLVILDLRLEPNTDSQKNSVGEISGAVVLNELRKKVKGVPVLMTTASNKVWSYEELMKLGADAYWMKEGIDNYYSAEDSVKNYYKLAMHLESMTSDRYKLLKHFEISVGEIKAGPKWFKSEIIWANAEKQKLNDDSINSINELLEDGILMLRTFLHQSFLGHSYCLSEIDSYWLTGIVNKLGGIIEEIHFPGRPGFDSSSVGGKWSYDFITRVGDWQIKKSHRQDWMAFILLNFRNAASHNKNGKELNDIRIVEFFIEILLYWLQMEKYEQFEKPIVINNSRWSQIIQYTNNFLRTNRVVLPNSP